jgi:hypothetical protein
LVRITKSSTNCIFFSPSHLPIAPTGLTGGSVPKHAHIEPNQNLPAGLAEIGLAGGAVIGIVVAPVGKVPSALEQARDAQPSPVDSEVPDQAVPILIQPPQND